MLRLLALATSALAVRVELHFMSECHECQMHIAAINDDIMTGGLEASYAEAGIIEHLELSVDYYGEIGDDGTCESAAGDDPHGPQQCEIDRVHLCAQNMYGGTITGAAATWWPFVHCMFSQINWLKCGSNWFCEDYDDFAVRRDAVVNMCSAVMFPAQFNSSAIFECANGELGAELQAASFNRTAAIPDEYGFAAPFVNGNFVDAEVEWRLSPDQLHYGKTILMEVCNNLEDPASAAACANMTKPIKAAH